MTYTETKIWIDVPEHLKEKLVEYREAAEKVNKIVGEILPQLKRHMEKNYALPLKEYSYPSDFDTYEFRNIKNAALADTKTIEVTVRIKSNYLAVPASDTKIRRLQNAGLDVNKILCSGVLTKEQRQEILKEILEETP